MYCKQRAYILYLLIVQTQISSPEKREKTVNIMNKNLFDENGGSDEDIGFNTNKDYAKSYNKFRQKELLKKCKLSQSLYKAMM